ncbi:MAG: DUF2065 domain-containing protein [Nitrococcus sp.]|nr:DUF2065 domain-containing protein [Nitrococcus sp.]
MGQELLTAVALVLVIEGIIPFLSPSFLRRMMLQIVEQTDATLRITGFVTMLAGVILLYVVH